MNKRIEELKNEVIFGNTQDYRAKCLKELLDLLDRDWTPCTQPPKHNKQVNVWISKDWQTIGSYREVHQEMMWLNNKGNRIEPKYYKEIPGDPIEEMD